MKKDIHQIEFKKEKAFVGFEAIPLSDFFKNPKELICAPHKDNFYNILLIETGNGVLSVDFKDYPFEAGTIFTISPNQIQQHHLPFGASGFLLIFTQEFIVKYFDSKEVFRRLQIFDDAFHNPVIQLEGKGTTDILDDVKRMYYQQSLVENDEFTESILRSGLNMMLLLLERNKQKNTVLEQKNAYFQEFITFKNLVEQKAALTRSVSDYAAELLVSTKKLNYICQNVAHKTAKEVIDDIAILQIKRDLLHTQSTKQSTYHFGFDEPSNFVKYFKKNTGKTPYEFIREQTR